MVTKLKQIIKNYFNGIYFIDLVIILITSFLVCTFIADYTEIIKYRPDVSMESQYRKNLIMIVFLVVVEMIVIFKDITIIKKNDNKFPKTNSRILNGLIFVGKNGFKFKGTRRILIVSIILAVCTLITYLYFLAIGGNENNIFVLFFNKYPFKGSVIMLMILFICLIYTVKKTLDINVVNAALKKVNEGDIHEKITIDGSPAVKELAHNINLIKEGYTELLQEEMKNEKLKTELISNVSHDLKTPLTSIINYVNIIKRKDITEEERAEYIEILNQKSLRLKELIDDLFEMSKINSGNIKLDKINIDILALIHQEVGEYSTFFEEKNIEFRVTSDADSIYMDLDGRMMSRAIENILVNAKKYSMENTRVYINVQDGPRDVKITIKNIANYEMNFDENEIFERFARGDKSRNSKVEGSGLGLAITKSIVELHGGSIKINIEGDMFKMYIALPKNKEI